MPYSVDYEDLVKALATPTDKVSVRVMRKTLPCLRIVGYMKVAEFVGKKKSKLVLAFFFRYWDKKVTSIWLIVKVSEYDVNVKW